MILHDPVALVAPIRTPIGKLGGQLAGFEAYQLLSMAFAGTMFRYFGESATYQSVIEREMSESGIFRVTEAMLSGADDVPENDQEVLQHLLTCDEVVAGNVRNSIGNIARVAALDAGIPAHVPAFTVDRQCASSMEALAIAAAKINAGAAKKILVGGVESASRAPWMFEKTARPYAYFEPAPYRIRMSTEEAGDPTMGETAEILADEHGITREEMDYFALESHKRASAAEADGAFQAETWAFVRNPDGGMTPVDARDECVRADAAFEKLLKLRPVFRSKGGRVTAGNSSPLNDAASSCLVFSREEAERDNLAVAAWLRGVVSVGLDPVRMGLGPAFAIPKLLEQAGLGVDDIDLFEINEAFAAQVLACLRVLESRGCAIPPEKLNVNGGAIALGHPLGATGLRLVVTLVHALRARGLRRGIASLCVGGGQGMAVLVETR